MDCPEKGRVNKDGTKHDPTLQWYMVHDEVWQEATEPEERRGLLHLDCLERRLGRQLTKADFKGVPANSAIFWAMERG